MPKSDYGDDYSNSDESYYSSSEEEIEYDDDVDDEVDEEEQEEEEENNKKMTGGDNEDEDEEAGEEEDDVEEDEEEGESEDIEEEEPEPTKGTKKQCHLEILGKNTYSANKHNAQKRTLVPDSERTSKNIMTKYELTSIIGVRARQIEKGAPLYFDIGNDVLTHIQKAYIEVMLGILPFIIRRLMPDNKYEEWKVSELNIYFPVKGDVFINKHTDLEKMCVDNNIEGRIIKRDEFGYISVLIR